MRPIFAPFHSVNHNAPSGPGVMDAGRLSTGWNRILDDAAAGRDAADSIRQRVGEPQGVIRAGRDA